MAVSIEDVKRALALRAPADIDEPVATRAAVALLLREDAAGLELLFILRARHPQDPWSGQMGFPGGRAEPGESVERAALRETLEELGLDLDACAEPLGRLDAIRAMARGRPVDLSITPFVFALREDVALRPNHEVEGVHWLALERLLGPEWRSTLDWSYEGRAVTLPCLRVGEQVIWGLTFRMFTDFETRLETARGTLLGPAQAEP